MEDFTDSARDGLVNLQQEWLELNGQDAEAMDLEHEQERLELEEQIAEAQAQGNTEAEKALKEQLALLDKIHKKKMADMEAEEQEEEKSRNEIDTLENRAILALVDVLEKQPQHRAYQLGVTLEVFAGYVSPAAVKDQLNRHIKAKLPNHRRDVKVERLKKFLEAYDMITSNYPLFLSKYMVNQALRNGVLYTDSGKVFWRSKVNSPEHHAWRSTQSLVLALSESMGDFDPEKEINNSLFGDMYEDLKTKGVQVNV